MIHPAADLEQLLLAIELYPGKLHVPHTVYSLPVDEIAPIRQEKSNFLQFFIVEDSHNVIFLGVHNALVDEVDIVL